MRKQGIKAKIQDVVLVMISFQERLMEVELPRKLNAELTNLLIKEQELGAK